MPESATIDPETADWLTLDGDEEIVWSGKPHEVSLIPALVVGLPLALILIGLLIIAGSYLQRENTQYVVTTDGLYKKTGVLSRDVQRIDFGKVKTPLTARDSSAPDSATETSISRPPAAPVSRCSSGQSPNRARFRSSSINV